MGFALPLHLYKRVCHSLHHSLDILRPCSVGLGAMRSCNDQHRAFLPIVSHLPRRGFSSSRFFNLPLVTVSTSDGGIRAHRLLSKHLRVVNSDTSQNEVIPQSLLMKWFRQKKFRRNHGGIVKVVDRLDSLGSGETIFTDREVYSRFFPTATIDFNEITNVDAEESATQPTHQDSKQRSTQLRKQLDELPKWFAFPQSLVYSDDHIVVLSKPTHSVSQGGTSLESVPNMHTVLQPLGSILSLLDGGSGVLRSVHRLDWGVSGLIIYCRTLQAAHHVSAAFRHDQVGKAYLGILPGCPQFLRSTLSCTQQRQRSHKSTKVCPPNLTIHDIWTSDSDLAFITDPKAMLGRQSSGTSISETTQSRSSMSRSLGLAQSLYQRFLRNFSTSTKGPSTAGTLCAVYHGTVTGTWTGPFAPGTPKYVQDSITKLPADASTEGFVYVFRLGLADSQGTTGTEEEEYRTVMSLHPLSGCKHQLRIHAQVFHGQQCGFYGDERYSIVRAEGTPSTTRVNRELPLAQNTKQTNVSTRSVLPYIPSQSQLQGMRTMFRERMLHLVRHRMQMMLTRDRVDWMSDLERTTFQHYLEKHTKKNEVSYWDTMNPTLAMHTKGARKSRAIALHAYGLVLPAVVGNNRLNRVAGTSNIGPSQLEGSPSQQKPPFQQVTAENDVTHVPGCKNLFLRAQLPGHTSARNHDLHSNKTDSSVNKLLITEPPVWMQLLMPTNGE